ncbi:MAG: hypothetical protein ACRDK3_07560 [Actinomycetota bacterium]
MQSTEGFCAECARRVSVPEGAALVCPVCSSNLLGPWVDEERQRRVGRNEMSFRDRNEERAAEAGALGFFILCECGHMSCDRRIFIDRTEYEEIRAEPLRFIALPGHEIEHAEKVVDQRERYNVVEKLEGARSEVIEELER